MKITHARMLELIEYCPVTGHFVRKSTGRQVRANKDGYVYFRLDGKNYYGHRLAWFYVMGEWPVGEVDHIDLDRANNAFQNLRLATHSLNGRNCRARSHNKVGLKGVSYREGHKRPYRAQISVDGVTKTIGSFSSALEAHAAYCAEASKLCKEFARAA